MQARSDQIQKKESEQLPTLFKIAITERYYIISGRKTQIGWRVIRRMRQGGGQAAASPASAFS